jgi:hypothetical protein
VKSRGSQSQASVASPSTSDASTRIDQPLLSGNITTPLISTHFSLQLPQSPEPRVEFASLSTEQRRIDEDVDMDDNDDLYGPLPEDLDVPDANMRSMTDIEMDNMQVEREPTNAGSASAPPENISAKNLNRETSWMHGRYANVAEDPWDRLLRSKNACVVNRPKTKVQAKKLDRHQAGGRIKVESLNFFIDEWLKEKR